MTSKDVVITEPVETNVLTGLVTIVATDKASHMKKGEEYVVSGQLATTLIKKGFATLKN